MSAGAVPDARRSAERAARDSYGRLVAILAARSRDVAAAEDALADAFRAALETWPLRGIPDNPEAWLLVAARRELGHGQRRDRVRAAGAAALALLSTEEAADASMAIPDERLKLLFACAHPAIDPAVQAPLMLQTVLGLDAQRIAGCFLTAPSAMSQRLVRAKARIKAAGIPFAIPEPEEMEGRLAAVLDAVYATYGTGWEDVLGEDPRRKGLTEEAIWLGRLLCSLLPSSPEAKGLLALMLHGEARRFARRDGGGRFVPLAEQDRARWDLALIDEAEALLHDASTLATLGRYQIEAAIQSLHVHRAFTGDPRTTELRTLYDWLAQVAPTTGVLVARAAVAAEDGDVAGALADLDALEPSARSYQPWWAVRARALCLLERMDEAAECFRTAAGLTEDVAVRDHLLAQAAALSP